MAPAIGQSLIVQPGTDGPIAGAVSTLTAALQQAQSGMTLELTPGTYSQQNGEQFPLVVPDGVSLRSRRSQSPAMIQGGGLWQAADSGQVAVCLVLSGHSQIQDLTLSNSGGTGVWIPFGRPQVQR
ncbi:hypothetical protein C7271_04765, partial [filamentous cyanobacterium CCP5]